VNGARFLVSGKVQGVWFRAATRERALALQLRGYARNLADGGVEVVATGAEGALDELEKWLWQGPPLAKVDQVRRQPLEAGAAFEGFATR
jgi:acylphosphatase